MSIFFQRLSSFLYWRYHRLRNFWPFWFYLLNRESRRFWREHKVELNSLQKRIVGEISQEGIALCHLSELLPDRKIFDQMLQRAALLKREGGKEGRKDFWIYLMGESGKDKELDLENPFIKFALNERILEIAGAYLKLAPRFTGFYLMETVVMPDNATAKLSQLWHRDPDDKKMLKIFLYLTDVDEIGAGPFMYIKGSHLGGKWRNLFPQLPPVGRYPEPGAIEKAVPKSDIKICLGWAGTVIFCDTAGLHKGGFSTTKSRLMFMGCFTSQASILPKLYKFPPQKTLENFSSLAKFALTL